MLRKEPQTMQISAAYQGKRYDYHVTEIPFHNAQDHAFTLGIAKDITEECVLRKQMNVYKQVIMIFYNIYQLQQFCLIQKAYSLL